MSDVADKRKTTIYLYGLASPLRSRIVRALDGSSLQLVNLSRYFKIEEAFSADKCRAVIVDAALFHQGDRRLRSRLRTLSRAAPLIVLQSAGEKAPSPSEDIRIAFIIPRPESPDEVRELLEPLLLRLSDRENDLGADSAAERGEDGEAIVTESESIRNILRVIRRFAPHKTPVLLTGESGTGKELLARALHAASTRKDNPLIAVNCAAIPENLLESELFGHAKGAFTGAHRRRKGLIEEAHQGTLFLDEIGEMPVALQAKLLRVLERGEIRPLGDARTIPVDIRVVCATSRDLRADLRNGRFRKDLLYRINVLSVHIPPLRDRPEDIPCLARHFLSLFSRRLGRDVVSISPPALEAMRAYHWPGNVRELQHIIERGVILSSSKTLELDALPPELHECSRDDDDFSEDLSIKRGARRLEIDLIQRALRRTGGNRTHAAKLLEISHRTLLYKIKEYGISL